LKSFFIKVFQQQPPENLKSDLWKTIGFQSHNPRTDFRGAGLLGLHCLRYFCEAYSRDFHLMREDKTETFLIAITSFNLTHMLMIYLFLNKHEVPEESKRLRAGRKQLKRFASLNASSKRAFYELHSYLLLFTYHLWF
jgi:hypothetical protein